MWPVALSRRLPIVALVGRYLTNKLIGHGPLSRQNHEANLTYLLNVPATSLTSKEVLAHHHVVLAALSLKVLADRCYSTPRGKLPMRSSPFRRSTLRPKADFLLDLHV